MLNLSRYHQFTRFEGAQRKGKYSGHGSLFLPNGFLAKILFLRGFSRCFRWDRPCCALNLNNNRLNCKKMGAKRQIFGHLVPKMVSNGPKVGKNWLIPRKFWHGKAYFFLDFWESLFIPPPLGGVEYGQNIYPCWLLDSVCVNASSDPVSRWAD